MTRRPHRPFRRSPGVSRRRTRSPTRSRTTTRAISNTATVTVGVTGVNHPPVANADTYSTPADTTLNDGSSVLTNDTDADGDTLTAILVSGPSHADAFTLNSDGTFSYTPETGFTNTDTFTYKANDGTADSTPITVTINVGP